jgi:hypothetical protein
MGAYATLTNLKLFSAVDKFHFKRNHIGRWCLKNTNPYTHKELKTANMSICEQRFKWWGGFRRSFRYLEISQFPCLQHYKFLLSSRALECEKHRANFHIE